MESEKTFINLSEKCNGLFRPRWHDAAVANETRISNNPDVGDGRAVMQRPRRGLGEGLQQRRWPQLLLAQFKLQQPQQRQQS
jgi:hypothetical protein